MGGSDLLVAIGAGASLIVGTVSADGEPRAARAWAAHVVDDEAMRLRVVMGADDEQAVANLATGTAAITGADVATLQSLQLKGHIVAVESPTPADLARAQEHTAAFLRAVEEADGTPVASLRRIVPQRYVVFELAVEGWFDQSPGPAAGAAVGAGR